MIFVSPSKLDNEEETLRNSGVLMINADLVAQTLSSKAEWLVSDKVETRHAVSCLYFATLNRLVGS